MLSIIDVLAALLVFVPLYTVILWHWANYLGFKRGVEEVFKTLGKEVEKQSWSAKRSSSSFDE